jgi:hypothetical protein
MSNNALVATSGTYITPNGVISGTGTLAVGFLGLQNDGTLAPGITMLYPLATAAPLSVGHAQEVTGTMAISGTMNIGPTGRLEIPLTGSNPGQYGSLAVTGAAALDGVLALDFRNGYAPKQGDTFTFLTATEGISGTFHSVEISGLAPGFEYKLSIANGQVNLLALNDGTHLLTLFLPFVQR